MSSPYRLIAKTVAGFEAILAAELQALGATDAAPGRRLVTFTGDLELLYRTNIHCRTAIRILKLVGTFPATSEDELYRGVQSIDWPQFLSPDGTLAIDPIVYSSFTTHSLFAAQLTKDAIVDQFRDRFGRRPNVDKDQPDVRINLHLNENQASLYLDASGDSLHRRGYRTAAGEAPLSEVLAAGILQLARWNEQTPLVDFMCGSGTFVIEAALLARRIAPGTMRPLFGYETWPDYDEALQQRLLAEARAAELPGVGVPLLGNDLDAQVIEMAKHNAKRAGVAADIQYQVGNFETTAPPAETGLLVCNPPYDERLKASRIELVYARLGEVLKRNWQGWRVCIFSGNPDAAKQLGLKPDKRTPLKNGPIECRLLEYSIRRRGPAQTVATAARADESDATVANENPPLRVAVAPPRRTWEDQTVDFRNRLTRMAKHWAKWARRRDITCYRVYERDVPEIPLLIDWYDGHLAIAEYDRPHDRTDVEQQLWLEYMVGVVSEVLQVERSKIFLKTRQRQRGDAQYEKLDATQYVIHVREGGHTFEVNLSDYLDTGLFLDHRNTRAMVQAESAGKRVLNLFGYTGAFTVYAVAGGASSSVTVDLSNTYVEWAERNLRLNHLAGPQHEFIRDDAREYLRHYGRRRQPPFDLAVVDPPTFSTSTRTEHDWDVQANHMEVLDLVLRNLRPGGKIYFSTNFRRFKFFGEQLLNVVCREISKQTIPDDFRNQRIHRCWTIIKQG